MLAKTLNLFRKLGILPEIWWVFHWENCRFYLHYIIVWSDFSVTTTTTTTTNTTKWYCSYLLPFSNLPFWTGPMITFGRCVWLDLWITLCIGAANTIYWAHFPSLSTRLWTLKVTNITEIKTCDNESIPPTSQNVVKASLCQLPSCYRVLFDDRYHIIFWLKASQQCNDWDWLVGWRWRALWKMIQNNCFLKHYKLCFDGQMKHKLSTSIDLETAGTTTNNIDTPLLWSGQEQTVKSPISPIFK